MSQQVQDNNYKTDKKTFRNKRNKIIKKMTNS